MVDGVKKLMVENADKVEGGTGYAKDMMERAGDIMGECVEYIE